MAKTKPRKYLDATHWEKVRHAFELATPRAVLKGVAGAASQEHWHERVMVVIERLGISSIDEFNYIAYADGLRYKVGKYVWLMDRALEHQILRRKWEMRGLDPLILDEIDKLYPWDVGRLP